MYPNRHFRSYQHRILQPATKATAIKLMKELDADINAPVPRQGASTRPVKPYSVWQRFLLYFFNFVNDFSRSVESFDVALDTMQALLDNGADPDARFEACDLGDGFKPDGMIAPAAALSQEYLTQEQQRLPLHMSTFTSTRKMLSAASRGKRQSRGVAER